MFDFVPPFAFITFWQKFCRLNRLNRATLWPFSCDCPALFGLRHPREGYMNSFNSRTIPRGNTRKTEAFSENKKLMFFAINELFGEQTELFK